MLATRFIIALCPSTPIYLASVDPIHREGCGIGQAVTNTRDSATQFQSFEAAMEVANFIKGWGGAQRVEQIAVEVPDTLSTIGTEDDLNEVRDFATAATAAGVWMQTDSVDLAAAAVTQAMRDLGLTVSTEVRHGASSPLTVWIADHLGNTAQLDWDPMQDGFDVTESSCAADDGDDDGDDDGPTVTVSFTRSEAEAITRAALGAVQNLNREIEALERGPCDSVRLADHERASAALNRLVSAVSKAIVSTEQPRDRDPEDPFPQDIAAAMTRGYLSTALWASVPLTEDGESEQSLESKGYGIDEVCMTSKAQALHDLRDFYLANRAALNEAIASRGLAYNWEAAGSDFFLSRNGHGAGFRDRGPEGFWARLQKAARVYGPTDQVEENTDGTCTIR